MCGCDNLIKAINTYIEKADGDLADAIGKEGYAKPCRTMTFERDLEDDVAAVLLDQTNYFTKHIEQ